MEKARKVKGKRTLIRYLSGERLGMDEVIEAKCYECVGYGEGFPCAIVECPNWEFCPFKADVSEEVKVQRRKARLALLNQVIV